MKCASCRAGSGVVDVPLLAGEVLNTSVTDGHGRALAADEHRQCPQIMMTYLSLDWPRAGL